MYVKGGYLKMFANLSGGRGHHIDDINNHYFEVIEDWDEAEQE